MRRSQGEENPIKSWFSIDGFTAMKWYWQWACFAAIALVLYIPILGNGFVNDDHLVIWKVCVENELNVDGFFRPLSDITIWITYQFAKLTPWPYYTFSILLHALTAVLLLQYCKKMLLDKMQLPNASLVVLLAAVFFLIYPYHNEAIVWILARCSLMAGTLAIASLLILVSSWSETRKMIGISLCYFVGLASYESIMILPAMLLAQLLISRAPFSLVVRYAVVLLVTFALHCWLRITVSGVFIGGYGKGFFENDLMSRFTGMLKTAGRIILPPSDNSQMLVVNFAVVAVLAIIAAVLVWRKTKKQVVLSRFFLIQLACFAFAMLMPLWLGVSTRTSESDRFFYLPAFFFCTILAFMVVYLFNSEKVRALVVLVLLASGVYLLEQNNMNWKRASDSVKSLMAQVRNSKEKLWVVNLPAEIDGAYVFRIGFSDALRLYGVDSSRVKVVSGLTRDQELLLPEVIVPKTAESISWIAPATLVLENGMPGGAAIAHTGKALKALTDSIMQQERNFNFADAAYSNQIQQFLLRNPVPAEELRIAVPEPGSRLLFWNRKSWIRLSY
ncbi:hypothetical protein HHL16_18400 [Pseudoflavitalea sp. G-6-1-2]|uniref:hypothetical protein n=1 Tax=Pseudoflavitalea sp. G-6-1-2 TaxID=2728841 RepID=UPI00146E4B47|nr:hypothetical protein [Pseudoflavitalea sp. G-6-1-2]NML22862.1 hypothetical protein [Pseudoflavitalea sp. G-6-1-2]